ncbi:Serine/threonine-protein kinase PKH1 [Nakaseomyces bracarensis]|uniref:non-specific serine/threonine protein kinase n=1 Tax=Nakaseomyces bracarensis TaxID=273131 RepID=A0ABR4NV24_9SACH
MVVMHDSKPGIRPLVPIDEVELTAKLSAHHSSLSPLSSVRSNSMATTGGMTGSMPGIGPGELMRVPTREKALTDTSHFIVPTGDDEVLDVTDEDNLNETEDGHDNANANSADGNKGDNVTVHRDVKDAELFKKQLIIKKGIKDFKFGEMLGDGSYSQVFLATSKSDSKTYAVKVLNKEYLIKQKKVKYVNIEKNALQKLKTVNGVINLSFTFQDESNLYFLLEYAPNGDFLSLIKKFGTLDENCTCYYSAQIIDAIGSLHARGIIHRDIKPENILIDANMKVKITDFGTAKILEKNKTDKGNTYDLKTKSHSFVGTAEYVAPELLSDNYTDYKCDVWAFGCLLFQMIAGKPPFKATNEYLTFQKVMKVQYAFSAGFPTIIRDLVKKILVRQPERRLAVAQIKKHQFFQNKNFDDNSVWTDEPPEVKPYRINAKAMQPFPPIAIPQTPNTNAHIGKTIIKGNNISYIQKHTNMSNSVSSPNLSSRSAPSSPVVRNSPQMASAAYNINVKSNNTAKTNFNTKTNNNSKTNYSNKLNNIQGISTGKHTHSPSPLSPTIEKYSSTSTTKNVSTNESLPDISKKKITRSQSTKRNLSTKIYDNKNRINDNPKVTGLKIDTKETAPQSPTVGTPRTPQTADRSAVLSPRNHQTKSNSNDFDAPELPPRNYRNEGKNLDTNDSETRNDIKRRFSTIQLSNFMDIQKEHVLNNVLGDIMVVDSDDFNENKNLLYSHIVDQSFRSGQISSTDTKFEATQQAIEHPEEDYYWKTKQDLSTLRTVKTIGIKDDNVFYDTDDSAESPGLYLSPCAFIVTTYGRGLILMENNDKNDFTNICSINLFCSGTTVLMNDVGIISIVTPFLTFILRCSKNDILLVFSAVKRSIKLNPDTPPPPSIPSKTTKMVTTSNGTEALQAARLANPILAREKYHRMSPKLSHASRNFETKTDPSSTRMFNSFVNSKRRNKKPPSPMPKSDKLINGLPNINDPPTKMLGLGLSQRIRRSGERVRTNTPMQGNFSNKNESFLRYR